MIWGRNAVANTVPGGHRLSRCSRSSARSFPAYKGLMMAISVAMFVFLYLALKRTRIGLVIQAALTHPQMVGALGHDVPGVFVLVFAVGSALAGLAGVIGGFMLLTQPTLAHAIGPIVFVVVVVGGLGSLAGALIASMLIGILQTFAVAVDYSLLDLLRALGIAVVARARRSTSSTAIKLATAAPIVPVPAAGADADRAAARPARHARRMKNGEPRSRHRRSRPSRARARMDRRRLQGLWLATAAILARPAARAGPQLRTSAARC